MAQHIGADRVALVLRQVIALRTLAGEDVEMIEPEVDHHFIKLPLTDHRASDLGRLQFRNEPPCALRGRPHCRGVRGGGLSAGGLLLHARRRILREQSRRTLGEHGELR